MCEEMVFAEQKKKLQEEQVCQRLVSGGVARTLAGDVDQADFTYNFVCQSVE